MHPKNLSILDFTYPLPADRIAQYPLPERDQSRLLVYQNGEISESIYARLADHLPEHTLLIFNNTKVVEARLVFEKNSGSKIEIFCLEPDNRYADITTAMMQKGKVFWKCLVGGAKKWKEGSLFCRIAVENTTIILEAKKQNQSGDSFLIELSWNDSGMSFAELLHHAGSVPLPPYLNRSVEETDKERYQTIYAKWDGSVAAPTAGLHFTNKVFEQLHRKKIQHDFITLHVGAGTFKPVKALSMQDHEMHSEFIEIKKSFLKNLVQNIDQPIITVGTTSLRTVESLYWIGVKTKLNPQIPPEDLQLSQWEAYELPGEDIPVKDAILSLINWMDRQGTDMLYSKTQIIIAPGYRFKIIKALITNFHQPQSTLLLLVAAIIGEDWKKVYDYALAHAFRFLSYGDGSLLWLKS
jgi:S-adenosylmethionine:tRNA ribosyltransferase-isomerase